MTTDLPTPIVNRDSARYWEARPASPWRRRLLALLAGGGALAVLFPRDSRARAALTRLTAEPIEQPARANAQSFIARAEEMRQLAVAHGDQSYGAVVVRDGRIIGQSWSRVVLDRDPTGHAEMSALRDAARRAGPGALVGAELYSTSHPCSMCEAAAEWVGIARMVHGADARDAGPPKGC